MIKEISILIEVDGQQVLMIHLNDDGLINRKGSLTLKNKDKNLYIGKTNGSQFEALQKMITPELLERAGTYMNKNQKKLAMNKLTVWLIEEAKDYQFMFVYPSGHAPPKEILELVRSATRVTEPWYTEQKNRPYP